MVCAAVRANTFIPVGVKDFHIAEGVEAWTPGARCVVHGEILEQHPEFLVADVRYERVVAKPIGNGRSPNGKRKGGAGTDARAGETREASEFGPGLTGLWPGTGKEARSGAGVTARGARAGCGRRACGMPISGTPWSAMLVRKRNAAVAPMLMLQ